MRIHPLLPRVVSCLLLGLLLGASAACTTVAPNETSARVDASDGGISPFPPVVRDLDNGMRAVLIKTPFPEIVALHITVSVGSRDEVEDGKSGFAHFFEHMMFRGTKNTPAEVYGDILKKAGADQNAYTTDDYTNYHLTFSKADLETVLELEADRFQHLEYSLDQFKTEARAVLGEYNKNYANPIRKLMEHQRDRVSREHTYKHTTMGFIADIEDMPNEFEYSREFYDRFYRPERTVVSVVGDIDIEQTYAWIERYFGVWKPGAATSAITPEPRQDGPLTAHVEWPSPTLPYVGVAFRGPAFSTVKKDMAAMDLIQSMLFSESGELYQKLVVEERKVDQLFPYFPNRKDPYLLSVFARVVRPEYAESVRDEILATFARARSELLDDDLLARTKSNLKYGFVQSLDSSEAIADVLARYVHFERDPDTIDSLYALYDSLTSDDLLAMSRKYFVDSQAHVITLAHEPLPGSWNTVPTVETAAGSDAAAAADSSITTHIDRNSNPLINFRLLFRTGPADDPPGKEGLASLTAAMITGAGSTSLTYKEIGDRRFPLATGFGAQVDKEMTVFSSVLHRDNLEKGYALMRDQLLHPGWREADFDRVKTNLINSIRVDLVSNNDEELGKEVLYQEIFRGHPYGHLNQGHIRSIEKLTIDDCRDYYADHYTQSNLTVGLAGGIPDDFARTVVRDLSTLPVGEDMNDALPPVADPDGWKMTIVQKDTRATGLHWGFPIEVTRSHPDFTALWLVRSWLGEHRSSNSHLYQRIREVRGMNYGDYAYIEHFPGGMFLMQPEPNNARRQQIFQVWIRPVVPENAPFALRVSLYEFEKLLDSGLSPADFEATREFLSKYVNLLVKTQDRLLGYELDSDFYGIGPFAEKIRTDLASLTLDDVNAAMRRHFQMENIQFVAVARDAEALREALASNRRSSITYDGDKPAELLAEDDIIHGYPFRFDAGDIRIVDAMSVFAGDSRGEN